MQGLAVCAADVVVHRYADRSLPVFGDVGVGDDDGPLHQGGDLERYGIQWCHSDVVLIASEDDHGMLAGREASGEYGRV